MKHRTLSSVLAAPLVLLLGFTSPGTAAADIETDKLTCAFTFWPGQGVYFLAQELGYFDEEGELVRTLTFSDFRRMGDRLVPARMDMQPHDKPGERTSVSYDELQFDLDIDRSFFSLRTLRRGR